MKHLNEIFYNGKMVNLQNMEEVQVIEILDSLRGRQVESKKKIDVCLDKMKNI